MKKPIDELGVFGWGLAIFLLAVIGFGVLVIAYTWGVSGRFPLIWVALGAGIGFVVFGSCYVLFEIPPAPREIIRSEDQARAKVAEVSGTSQEKHSNPGGKHRVERVTRSDTHSDTTPTRPQHASRSPNLSIEEKIFRAALSHGTMSVAVMWREFRDRDDVDIKQKELREILASLEGKKWTTPLGETYKVVSKPKHKGRRLVRV
jgi:hypothetical protein